MASSRETNTMAEGLRKVLQQITDMKTAADSDLPFLVDLETNVIQYLRNPQPTDQAQGANQPFNGVGAGAGGMGGAGPMAGPMASPLAGAMGQVMGQPAGMPPGMPPGMAPGVPGAMPGGAAGPMPGGPLAAVGPGLPNPGELQRMLTNASTRHNIRRLVSGASPTGLTV